MDGRDLWQSKTGTNYHSTPFGFVRVRISQARINEGLLYVYITLAPYYVLTEYTHSIMEAENLYNAKFMIKHNQQEKD